MQHLLLFFLEVIGHKVETFASAVDFLGAEPGRLAARSAACALSIGGRISTLKTMTRVVLLHWRHMALAFGVDVRLTPDLC